MSSGPAAVYVHVPFCHTLCGYCDFYSVVLDRRAVHPLVDALLREWRAAAEPSSLRAESIFVGGGTPTTLPTGELARLLGALHARAAPGCEFTVEANPATVSPDVAATLAAHGVTRVSIGAQSFDPGELRVLERIHRPEQVAQTVRTCRAAGIGQVNLDLIFAVPGQSLDAWLASLRRALELGPDHLSCYGLTYEPGTPLYERLRSGGLTPCEAELEAEMYEATIETLAAAGFEHYEISNFARPGCACRHNLAYWRNEPYVGIGPSGAGYVDGVRYKNVPDHAAYVQAVRSGHSPRIEQERRSADGAARETMMLGLRLVREGVPRARFAARHGRDPVAWFGEPIERFAALGLLEVDAERVRLTRAGLLVGDSIIAEFV